MEDSHVWGMIDSRPIVFPAEVEDAAMALVAYDVAPDAAAALGVPDAFAVAPTRAGPVAVTLMLADYRRAAWGPSSHVALAIPVRPRGDARVDGRPAPAGLLMCHSVGNTAFPEQVMYWALGVSGALGSVVVTASADALGVRVALGGAHALTVTLPRPSGPDLATAGTMVGADAYTCVGDVARRVHYRMQLPGHLVPPSDVAVEPGSGPLADAVRVLQAAGPPTSCLVGDHLRIAIHEPEMLDLGGGPVPSPRGTSPPRSSRDASP